MDKMIFVNTLQH